MVYKITFDTFTKIGESAGTIQNIGDYVIEMSENPTFDSGILILPKQKATFNNTDIYLRCVEGGFSSEIRVVPFIVDKGGGGDSSGGIGIDSNALKAVTFTDNTLSFYTTTDTKQAAAYTYDIPAEQFLDQANTDLVNNFMYSAILYPGATNPNLNGKPVLVLALKTKNNDGTLSDISYKFLDMSSLIDTYVASDTSLIISNYKTKVNVSPDAGNFLQLKNNGLYVTGVTDTATTTTAGLMSAADKSKLVDIEDSAQVNVIESVKVNNIALAISNKTVNIDLANATVKSAASLNSARSLKVSLASTNDQPFDGSANATVIGVSGILPTIYGGTGNDKGTVSGAAQLNTARNFVTDLSSTVSGSFNGTASVSAGVTGTLPVANGGTGQTDLNNITVGGAARDSAGNVISTTYVTKSEFDAKTHTRFKRYGYRISKTEADPYARVEYLYDAFNMTPAKMNFSTGKFEYGDWADVWFVKDNKPCMLKSDGTVDYYLDPNDYTKKEDGSASDVANTEYDGNAMAQIPLCWVYRYEDDDYLYEIVSNGQYDENYKAYAHTRADGSIADYFYAAMFGASGNASKLRSLSGQTLNQSMTTDQQLNGAIANGSGWYIDSWSRRELIRTLLVLIGKSTNTQAVFGNGNNSGRQSSSYLLPTGTLNDKGQFYGYSTNNQQVKVFHIESFWGDQWTRVAGFINSYGTIYIKMTPEGDGYRVNDTTGYTNTNITPRADYTFINAMNCNEYGMILKAAEGSNSTYFCDAAWSFESGFGYLLAGGSVDMSPLSCGAFLCNSGAQPTRASWGDGCTLSFA